MHITNNLGRSWARILFCADFFVILYAAQLINRPQLSPFGPIWRWAVSNWALTSSARRLLGTAFRPPTGVASNGTASSAEWVGAMGRQGSLRLVWSSAGEAATSGKGAEFDPLENFKRGKTIVDLGNGSEVLHVPRFIPQELSWEWFDYLDRNIPWSRPTLRIFDRDSIQPRDSCYVADEGRPKDSYSGPTPRAYSWNDYPPLKDILDVVRKALPSSSFNSVVLNRYKGGNDHVSWHSDEAVLYGPTPEIASITFGCEREFLLKKKAPRSSKGSPDDPARKRLKSDFVLERHSFTLKHGSLLVMRGYTQRDWLHSVPKRAKAMSTRINLTFRRVLIRQPDGNTDTTAVYRE